MTFLIGGMICVLLAFLIRKTYIVAFVVIFASMIWIIGAIWNMISPPIPLADYATISQTVTVEQFENRLPMIGYPSYGITVRNTSEGYFENPYIYCSVKFPTGTTLIRFYTSDKIYPGKSRISIHPKNGPVDLPGDFKIDQCDFRNHRI